MKFKKLMNMANGNFEVFTEASKHTITPVCCSNNWQECEELNNMKIKSFGIEPNLNDNGSINWKYPCRIIVAFDN